MRRAPNESWQPTPGWSLVVFGRLSGQNGRFRGMACKVGSMRGLRGGNHPSKSTLLGQVIWT